MDLLVLLDLVPSIHWKMLVFNLLRLMAVTFQVLRFDKAVKWCAGTTGNDDATFWCSGSATGLPAEPDDDWVGHVGCRFHGCERHCVYGGSLTHSWFGRLCQDWEEHCPSDIQKLCRHKGLTYIGKGQGAISIQSPQQVKT